jgi:hypothetical protein
MRTILRWIALISVCVEVVADAAPFLFCWQGGNLPPSLLLLLLELLLSLDLDSSLSALANPSAKAMLPRELTSLLSSSCFASLKFRNFFREVERVAFGCV